MKMTEINKTEIVKRNSAIGLTSNKRIFKNEEVYQIVALKDLEFDDYSIVSAGTLGGYVKSIDNIDDTSWVGENCFVIGKAKIHSKSKIRGSVFVLDEAEISNSTIYDDYVIAGNAYVYESEVSGKGVIDEDCYIEFSRIIDSQLQRNVIVSKSTVVESYCRDSISIFDSSLVSKSTLKGYMTLQHDTSILDSSLYSDNDITCSNCVIEDSNLQCSSEDTQIITRLTAVKADIKYSDEYMAISNLGSRNAVLSIYKTENGFNVNTGCFTGTVDEFIAETYKRHRHFRYAQQYRAAINLAKKSLNIKLNLRSKWLLTKIKLHI